LSVGDALYAISEAGLTVRISMTEDTLKVYPARRLTPELTAARTRWRMPGASFTCSAETEDEHARDERLLGPGGRMAWTR
jgi:hypothetical protein